MALTLAELRHTGFRLALSMAAILAPLCVAVSEAGAVTGPKLVSSSQLRQTSIVMNGRRERFSCLGTVPGTAARVGTRIRFTSFAYLLSRTSSSRDRARYDRYRALVRLGTAQCKRLPSPRSPSPTPTPAPTGNFDNNGNVTAAGKALFGIPSNLSANISTGRGVQTTYCNGCHVERTGYSFSRVRTAIAQSPMLFDESQIPNSQLAHLIAYLNRFRQ